MEFPWKVTTDISVWLVHLGSDRKNSDSGLSTSMGMVAIDLSVWLVFKFQGTVATDILVCVQTPTVRTAINDG